MTVRLGFESKAERARLFAAEMALQSFALMAAAEGAIAAYADITGETWKPYEAPTAPAASVARKSAAVEMAAFRGGVTDHGGGGAGRGSAPAGGGRPAQGFRSLRHLPLAVGIGWRGRPSLYFP